jgi:hypothetical protein
MCSLERLERSTFAAARNVRFVAREHRATGLESGMMLALCFLAAMTGSQGLSNVSHDASIAKFVAHLKVRLRFDGPRGCGPPPEERYEEAVILHAAYQFFKQPEVKQKLGSDYRGLSESVRQAATIRERELESIGVDVLNMKLHLRQLALAEGFPYARPTQWSPTATGELMNRGPLKGYSDGLFRGEWWSALSVKRGARWNASLL